MVTITRYWQDGSALDDAGQLGAADDALNGLGVEVGRWALRSQPVSSTPQLTYARELRALQERFATVRTDRLCWPERRPRFAGPPGDVEISEMHRHDDAEVRVVLDGRARFVLGCRGGWTAIDCVPGDWVALPAGLPHVLQTWPGETVDMLRLFALPGGWVAHRTEAGRPPTLAAAPMPMAA